MATEPSPATVFAYALTLIEGIGRVSARRIVDHFEQPEEVRRYPREQLLHRLKGIAHAERVAELLLDEAALAPYLEQAQSALDGLQQKRVAVIVPRDPSWPASLDDLPPGERPFLLYAYGDAAMLNRPLVALFARPPLDDEAFERAQALTRHLLRAGVVPVTGLQHGFDTVVHKITSQAQPPAPAVGIAACGLARIAPPLRPVVSAMVRAGGLALSPFSLTHGPFEHDDRERARMQAALTRACVFVDVPPQSPEASALRWAQDAGRPVFTIGASPDSAVPAHPVRDEVDFDWVVEAARRSV